MTGRARVRDLVLVGHRWRDELERVTPHVDVGDLLFDLRHMAGHTLASGAAGRMMRVLLDGRDVVRSVRGTRVVAGDAQVTGRFNQVRIVRRAMDVVAAEAGHTTAIHHALHEVIALHPILVSGALGEVHEIRLTELVVLELPVVSQSSALMKTDRPIVVLPEHRIRQRLSL